MPPKSSSYGSIVAKKKKKSTPLLRINNRNFFFDDKTTKKKRDRTLSSIPFTYINQALFIRLYRRITLRFQTQPVCFRAFSRHGATQHNRFNPSQNAAFHHLRMQPLAKMPRELNPGAVVGNVKESLRPKGNPTHKL